MRILAVVVALLIVAAITFMVGVANFNGLLTFAGFCSTPLLLVWLGWALHASGVRVTIGGGVQTGTSSGLNGRRPAQAASRLARRDRDSAL